MAPNLRRRAFTLGLTGVGVSPLLSPPAWAQAPAVPMPEALREAIESFVAEHHVEREFVKRKRRRADPEALARREHEGGQE